jgi:hypothetical protein
MVTLVRWLYRVSREPIRSGSTAFVTGFALGLVCAVIGLFMSLIALLTQVSSIINLNK